jgi:hypothetical protein
MASISFNIPDDKLPRIVAAMRGLYPVPLDAEGTPLFTDNQWAKEAIRRLVVRDVRRWEQKVASDAAIGTVTADDTLLS